MGKREALGILEDARLVRVTVDAWLGTSRLRLLAAPYRGGGDRMDPRAAEQWGEEHVLHVEVDGPPARSHGRLALGERILHALASRWPPPVGTVFLAAAETLDLPGASGPSLAGPAACGLGPVRTV